MQFRAITDENRKPQVNWERIYQYCARWAPGTPLEISITRRKPKRSNPMRKYYYAVVLPTFLDAYYYERDEAATVHTHLKCLYFRVKPDKHGIYRAKDIPAVFADDSDLDVGIKKNFTEWVIRKSAQSPDNPQYTPDPGER